MLEIKNNIEERDFWDAIKSVGQPFQALYTKSLFKYYKQNSSDEGWDHTNLSFIISENSKTISYFIGFFLKRNNENKICFFQNPCIAFCNCEKSAELVFMKIHELLNQKEGVITFEDHLITNYLSPLSEIFFKNGLSLLPTANKTINLHKPLLSIKQGIRKSFKNLINKSEELLTLKVINKTNFSSDYLSEFRILHAEVSGRETRSLRSWEIQGESVKEGEAFFVFGYEKDELISAGWFPHDKVTCFYGSSASRRERFEKPIFHGILWKAIEHAKSIGCLLFDFGEISSYLDQKGGGASKAQNISRFKSGFGGVCRISIKSTGLLQNKISFVGH